MPILEPAFFPFKTVLEWWICTFFDEVFLQKITLMWRRWGTSQNFLLAFIDELWKTQKIRILKKWKKNCWRYHHFTYVNQKPQSWGTVPDIQSENFFFCHFGPFFALYPLPLQQPRKPKFWKNGSIWRCHHFKLVLQKTQSHDVCLLRYGVQQT